MGSVTLNLNGKEFQYPSFEGSEGEVGIDIAKLRGDTGAVTFDPGYGNTGSCKSAITFIDGDAGILRYRGYPIEQIAEKCTFLETSYLLIYGELPDKKQIENFQNNIARHTLIHEDMKNAFTGFPNTAHPMAVLSAMTAAMSAYYPHSEESAEKINLNIIRLLAKMKTIAAFAFKKSIGQPYVYPQNHLSYPADFLNMMFSVPAEAYEVSPTLERALELLLILHADHEQNCSTSTVRMVGSSQANIFASIAAGICALWGPLHGGANQEVIGMLEDIKASGVSHKDFLKQVKDKDSGSKLMGFGHRVYKNFDPRAKILKKACDDVLSELGIHDPTLEIAKALEEAALSDDYFISRKLYPNVDFYSGIIYRAMGFPSNMFTPMFALGRLPGWIAQWKEQRDDKTSRIHRPRQIYTGAKLRDVKDSAKR